METKETNMTTTIDITQPEVRSVIAKVDERLEVVFKDLEYLVPIKVGKKKQDKKILKGINGVFEPGKVTVIMGASGAGKTSLLNVISGETGKGTVKGTVMVNGNQISPKKMKSMSGFVFQDDLILETMTVREAITMSAKLRLPDTYSESEKLARVSDIIRILGLEKAADTIVGSTALKGISGGERKRTSMAMEMVINPSILFLDEPTSGLDTYTAYSVVKSLSDLAKQGRTVIATIHQPSSEIFHLFDNLLLLAEGQVLYNGPVSKVVDYFSARGYTCPQYSNPADYIFMSILNSTDIPSAEKQMESPSERFSKLMESWKTSPENKNITLAIENCKREEIQGKNTKDSCHFPAQFKFLFFRAGKNALRNKLMVRAKFAQSVIIAIVIGLIYLNINDRALEAQGQDRIGALFFLSVNMFMMSATGVLAIFSTEKLVFIREYSAGYYSLPAYYLSKTMVELPFQIIFPIITVSIEYWMIGFQNQFVKYVIMCVVAILVALCGMAMGTLSACAFNDLPVALAIFPLIFLPLMMFSGLFVNTNSIPVYFDWIKYLSPMKYGFETLMKNEFTGLVFKNCPSNLPQCQGESVLQRMNLQGGLTIEQNLGILFSIYAGLLLLAFLALYRIVRKKR